MKKFTFYLCVLLIIIGLYNISIFANDTIVKKPCFYSPIIDVAYYDFGDIPVNTSANGSIEIRNLGNVELIITGYTGPRPQTIFIPDLIIDPGNPLRIAPGEVFTYEVRFLPKDTSIYTDSMVFISNSIKNSNVDSIGEIKGRGFKPDLIANGYDWGRRRIDRHNFPAGPYDADTWYRGIQLTNGSTEAITIYNIKTISDINGTAFEFDRGLLANRQIKPGETITVPVRFHPVVAGPHELIFSYDNSAGSNTQTALRGIGTVPQLETSDYDFGTTNLNDTSNPNNRTIRITNKSAIDWVYGDSVTIINIDNMSFGYEISEELSRWGSEGFRFNKLAFNLPVKLAQGECIEFNAQFTARKFEQSKGTLKINSDALYLMTTTWTGYGIDASGISISVSDAGFGKVLRNTVRTKTIYITNVSDSVINISNYTNPALTEYYANITREISINNPLILQPHETWSFDVDFNAQSETPNSFRDSIVFTSNATQGDSIAYLNVDSVVITGVDEFSESVTEIKLFPNPADDYLTISFQDLARKPGFVKLFDYYGNIVFEKKNINDFNLKISTIELASGMYVLQVGNLGLKKIVVVH